MRSQDPKNQIHKIL